MILYLRAYSPAMPARASEIERLHECRLGLIRQRRLARDPRALAPTSPSSARGFSAKIVLTLENLRDVAPSEAVL